MSLTNLSQKFVIPQKTCSRFDLYIISTRYCATSTRTSPHVTAQCDPYNSWSIFSLKSVLNFIGRKTIAKLPRLTTDAPSPNCTRISNKMPHLLTFSVTSFELKPNFKVFVYFKNVLNRMPEKHKESNKYKFRSFSERVKNVRVSAIYRAKANQAIKSWVQTF